MKQWRKVVALALVFTVLQFVAVRSAAGAVPMASVKDQVAAFGVGAKVGLKLAGGGKARGRIEAIDEHGFLLSADREASRRIAYDQVAHLSLAERAYRAKGAPDGTQARRVVLSLGVGRHVGVKFSGREVHGHIQAIEADRFTVLPDRQTAPVEIAYNDVRYVEKNISFGATIVLVVLIAAAVVVIAMSAKD